MRRQPGGVDVTGIEAWSRARWVCPHDPSGIDHDTATYCPQAVSSTTPWPLVSEGGETP